MGTIYGYARVSSKGQAHDGNSLEDQERQLREEGATKIYADVFTGTKLDRPEFDKLISKLEEGDTLMVTKLDRFARSAIEGSKLVNELISKGVRVNILNIGVMDNKPTSKLIRNIFFAFAEFERDMIVERTQAGKAVAKARAEAEGRKFVEGRPQKFTQKQITNAMEMLDAKKSYTEVTEITGISRSTLVRERRKWKAAYE